MILAEMTTALGLYKILLWFNATSFRGMWCYFTVLEALNGSGSLKDK